MLVALYSREPNECSLANVPKFVARKIAKSHDRIGVPPDSQTENEHRQLTLAKLTMMEVLIVLDIFGHVNTKKIYLKLEITILKIIALNDRRLIIHT